MRSRTANLSTRSVRYLEAGSGHPIVLIHAFPLNAEQWLPQLAGVAPGCRVIAPDMRGFSGSDPYAGLRAPLVTMDTYADDVLELMAHLDLPRAVIGGLSMGGYIALALARKAPLRVDGLVLADTRATADSDEAKAGRDRMVQLVTRDGPSGVATSMLPRLLGTTTQREQPDLADAVRMLIESSGSDGIAAATMAMKTRADSTLLLPAIACPTAIVCGTEDVLTPPSDSEIMLGVIPHAHLTMIPRAGHLSNLENPTAFNAALYAFVSTLPSFRAPARPFPNASGSQ